VKYGEKIINKKMVNSHCRTWNMAGKVTKEENEKLTW
jgi:hypothetical protein